MDCEDSSDDDELPPFASGGQLHALAPNRTRGQLISPPSLWSSSEDDDALDEYESENPVGSPSRGESRWIGDQPRRRRARAKMVQNYLIGAKLGEGAYATVREALNSKSLRICAAKVVDTKKLRRLKGGMDALQREMSVQKALKRHPNLVELLDVHQDVAMERTYLFMEIANGCAVDVLLQRSPSGRLPAPQVAHYVHQVLTGLIAMHRLGIVHRDVKPGNMLLNADGKLKISDFGVAEFLDRYTVEDNVTRTSGSPAFQAPEIAKGDEEYSGMKVDVWALGVSAFQMLTGSVPFDAGNLMNLFATIAEGKYARIPENLIDEAGRNAIESMLVVDWHERASVEQLLQHPWIANAEVAPSKARMEKEGWIPIPRKKFSVLNLAQGLVSDGEEGKASIPISKRTVGSSKPSACSLKSMFREPERNGPALSGDGTRNSTESVSKPSNPSVVRGPSRTSFVDSEAKVSCPSRDPAVSSVLPENVSASSRANRALDNVGDVLESLSLQGPSEDGTQVVSEVPEVPEVSEGEDRSAPDPMARPFGDSSMPVDHSRADVVRDVLRASVAVVEGGVNSHPRPSSDEPDLLASALAKPHVKPLCVVDSTADFADTSAPSLASAETTKSICTEKSSGDKTDQDSPFVNLDSIGESLGTERGGDGSSVLMKPGAAVPSDDILNIAGDPSDGLSSERPESLQCSDDFRRSDEVPESSRAGVVGVAANADTRLPEVIADAAEPGSLSAVPVEGVGDDSKPCNVACSQEHVGLDPALEFSNKPLTANERHAAVRDALRASIAVAPAVRAQSSSSPVEEPDLLANALSKPRAEPLFDPTSIASCPSVSPTAVSSSKGDCSLNPDPSASSSVDSSKEALLSVNSSTSYSRPVEAADSVVSSKEHCVLM